MDIKYLKDDPKLISYLAQLEKLRENGVAKINELETHMAAIKKNKMISDKDKVAMITSYKNGIAEAVEDSKKNKDKIDALSKEAVEYVNKISVDIEKAIDDVENANIATYKAEIAKGLEKVKVETAAKLAKVTATDPKERKIETDIIKYEAKSAVFDVKNHYNSLIDKSKDNKNQAYIDHVQTNRTLRNGKTVLKENIKLNITNYINKFKLDTFLIANGLYLAILIFFIVCVIVAPISGKGNLLSLPNIFTILEQSSTRMFFALGVAGLILLAGTDLSIGRMVAMGAVTTGLILHPGLNIVKFFSFPAWDFTTLPMGFRVVMALTLSIVFCVLFSSFSGFFSAKLKIHPFISTLSTQLIIYGFLFFGTSGTPVGSIDGGIKDAIGGRWILGALNGQLITFPKLIIPAVIAILVVWFVWNKTIFGKNMYAVGGNSEAAAVSGISVFKVTMGVFIMAGILYGAGSFLEAFRANASAGTGQGYELDAIAACVVGGISFNGGIGKVSGAVMGVIIFTGLTYCLTFLGIDTNLQFIFKGIIIIAAVALDSVKYLKKK